MARGSVSRSTGKARRRTWIRPRAARGARPVSSTATRHAGAPGGRSRSSPTSAAWPPAYGKKPSGRPPTEPPTLAPSGTSFTWSHATSPTRGRAGCQTPPSRSPAGAGGAPRSRSAAASAAGTPLTPAAAGGGTARSRRPARRRAAGRCPARAAPPPPRLGVPGLELPDVAGDLRVLRDDLREVGVELLDRLVEVAEVERGAEEGQHALEEGPRRLRVLDARDVVRHVRPQARGREAPLARDRGEDADDARRPLVPRRAQAEAGGGLGGGGG